LKVVGWFVAYCCCSAHAKISVRVWIDTDDDFTVNHHYGWCSSNANEENGWISMGMFQNVSQCVACPQPTEVDSVVILDAIDSC
jgi:hypothetical protein